MRSIWLCMENGVGVGGTGQKPGDQGGVTAVVQPSSEGGWTRGRAVQVERTGGILVIPLGIS